MEPVLAETTSNVRKEHIELKKTHDSDNQNDNLRTQPLPLLWARVSTVIPSCPVQTS